MKNPHPDSPLHRRFAAAALMFGNLVAGCSVRTRANYGIGFTGMAFGALAIDDGDLNARFHQGEKLR
jgi:hypothetical protein